MRRPRLGIPATRPGGENCFFFLDRDDLMVKLLEIFWRQEYVK